ncbi:Holliday junction branch migration protein RuvA [soil metagenome]
MIAGLQGTIAQIEADALVIDVHGVFYRAYGPTSILQGGELRIGSDVFLHTHQVVREDSLTLYGFMSGADVTWFRTLLGVNGVGPRVALAMLSRFQGDQLFDVVLREDVGALSSVPGIGRKTASRILLDLRGKIPEPSSTGASVATLREDAELIEALESLGYTRSEAATASMGIDISRDADLEARLLAALRELSPAN